MKDRILVIADSLGMPRDGVSYEETWPYLIIQNHPNFEVIDKTKRASMSERLVNEGGGYKNIERGADLLEHYSPKISIIQLGITDCSPRYFRKKSLINLFIRFSQNTIKSLIYKFIKKYFKRRYKYSHITSKKFKNNFENYIERAKKINTQIIIIAILPATQEFVRKSPEVIGAIGEFNKILLDLSKSHDNVSFIDPIDKVDVEDLTIDELHTNSKGNFLVYNDLSKYL